PFSERKFQIFFSFNQSQKETWCVEGVDFHNYMEITCNIEKARKFLWVRVGEGAIQTPSCGIRSIYMSKDGVDFEKIEDLESIFDNSNTSELPNCSPQSMMYGDGASYNSSDDETTAGK
ncbi:hypothetical protein G9C98_000953, partial [Cotesia typhae]